MRDAPPQTTNTHWSEDLLETDGPIEKTQGNLPPDLVGILYRNGPAKNKLANHLFDGDGALRAVRFAPDGTASYQCRYVQTPKYSREQTSTKPLVRGFGTQPPGGILRNAMRGSPNQANASNTSVMFSNGRLLTLWEMGLPWELDPDTLETLGEMSFDGALSSRSTFSAHPRNDPVTQETYNFGMSYGPRNRIDTYRIDRNGRLFPLAQTPVPVSVMNHDFALTSKWAVFLLGPVIFNPVPLLTGKAPFGKAMTWKGDHPTTILLIPREGGKAIVFETDPWFQFHIAGAFDDQNEIVVDFCRYPEYTNIDNALTSFRSIEDDYVLDATLWRCRISPTRRTLQSAQICPIPMEFPHMDTRFATQAQHFIYGSFSTDVSPSSFGSAIGRVNTDTGKTDLWDFGPACATSEPIFVPRKEKTTSDKVENEDGWLLAFVYNHIEHATDLVVLDAARLENGTVWVGRLPHHAGMTFHGVWRPHA